MYDCTSNNWSHWSSKEKLKEQFGSRTRKTFDRFSTKDSYTRNSTHNTESAAAWSLKRERWGSALVREMYREEKACDRRQPYRIVIIVIIIIIIIIIIISCTGKTFDRFTTKDSYTRNSTHNTESAAAWSLKRERRGSLLVREKYRGEKACDRRQPYRIVIIIIITIIISCTWKHSTDSQKKTATLGTSHTIRKVLQREAWISPFIAPIDKSSITEAERIYYLNMKQKNQKIFASIYK